MLIVLEGFAKMMLSLASIVYGTLVVPADRRVKIKESEMIKKYLDLINVKVTEILILDGALGTISKGLEKRLE